MAYPKISGNFASAFLKEIGGDFSINLDRKYVVTIGDESVIASTINEALMGAATLIGNKLNKVAQMDSVPDSQIHIVNNVEEDEAA